MRWYFRDISDDPSEKDLTQQDQFNNDEVALAEAVVRETIQNSTDAQAKAGQPVRVRFAINEMNGDGRAFFEDTLKGIAPHLRACGIPIPGPAEPVRALVIEDFGTTGLTGSVDAKDDGQFSGFWRRFGRSNKKGKEGGRWGLGKLVFSSASAVRTLIGLTRRANEDANWVMGQAVLRNHIINGKQMDSVGFWCNAEVSAPGRPTKALSLTAKLSRAAKLCRTSEPGLSLVIPALLPDISSDLLVAATVRNYYFPILTGSLAVEIDEVKITQGTFDEVSKSLRNELVPHSLLTFVRQLHAARTAQPTLVLPEDWHQQQKISAETLGPEATERLREHYKAGKLLAVRAPLRIKPKGDSVKETHIDLFLKSATPGERSQALVVRGSITVPTEGKKITFPECHAALIADHEWISRLLGDAENPAHTQWSERAAKLGAGWDRGSSVLRQVRAALPDLYAIVAERIEREDPLALVEFFSIPKGGRPGQIKQAGGRPKDLPTPAPKPFRIEKRAGGFAILPNDGAQPDQFPMQFKVRCAYDVLTGNPYKRYSEYDFSFYQAVLGIVKENADCWPSQGNELDVVVRRPDFSIEVSGFDRNRDLIIEAQV